MKEYDKSKPLIAIHIPKSGGTSFCKLLEQWFDNNLYKHYYDETKGKNPKKTRLNKIISNKPREGICIYGHFNRERGFGLDTYYPEVVQFITILRDPFELVISEYFDTRRRSANWKDQSRIPGSDLEEHILNAKVNMLNHFPVEITLENYKQYINESFIYIGITEEMNTTTKAMAKKLGMPEPIALDHLNKSKRDQRIPEEFKQEFIYKHPIEYAVYNFARENYYKTWLGGYRLDTLFI